MKIRVFIIGFILLAVISVVAGFIHSVLVSPIYFSKGATPSPQPTITEPVASPSPFFTPPPITIKNDPDQITSAYYQWYIACAQRFYDNKKLHSNNRTIQQDCPYGTVPGLSQNLIDSFQFNNVTNPVLCSVSYPVSFSIDPSHTNADSTKTILIHTFYGEGEDRTETPITINTSLFGDSWQITSIVCNSSQ